MTSTDVTTKEDALALQVRLVREGLAHKDGTNRVALADTAEQVARALHIGRPGTATDIVNHHVDEGPLAYAGLMFGFADLYCGPWRMPPGADVIVVNVLPGERFEDAFELINHHHKPGACEVAYQDLYRFLEAYAERDEDRALHELLTRYYDPDGDRLEVMIMGAAALALDAVNTRCAEAQQNAAR